MTKQEIAALACRILALYLLVDAVLTSVRSSFPYLYQQYINVSHGISPNFPPSAPASIFMAEILSLLVPITSAVILWIRADWISRYMIQDGKEHRSDTKINAGEIQTIAFSSIGLFLFAESLPQLVVFLLAFFFPPQMTAPSFTPLELVYPLLEVLIGGWLLVKASILVHLLQRRD
jgi:hypothetical protein